METLSIRILRIGTSLTRLARTWLMCIWLVRTWRVCGRRILVARRILICGVLCRRVLCRRVLPWRVLPRWVLPRWVLCRRGLSRRVLPRRILAGRVLPRWVLARWILARRVRGAALRVSTMLIASARVLLRLILRWPESRRGIAVSLILGRIVTGRIPGLRVAMIAGGLRSRFRLLPLSLRRVCVVASACLRYRAIDVALPLPLAVSPAVGSMVIGVLVPGHLEVRADSITAIRPEAVVTWSDVERVARRTRPLLTGAVHRPIVAALTSVIVTVASGGRVAVTTVAIAAAGLGTVVASALAV